MKMINKERLLETFINYVKISSKSLNERDIANRIIADLNEFSYDVYEDNAGEKLGSNANNLYFFLDGETNAESFIFSSHMDTVIPCDNIEPYIKEGFVSTDGSTILGADDKAGIAAIVEALRIIKENNITHRPIEVIFTINEEGGLHGSKNLQYEKLRSKKAIVLDSSGEIGKIIIGAPGQNNLSAKIIGKAAHAGGEPENGISSIIVAAEAISKMELLRIDNETTANIGSLTAISPTNIVCPEANLKAEIRSRDESKLNFYTEKMIDELKKACNKFGAKLEHSCSAVYNSYKIDENDEFVIFVEEKCKEMEITSITKEYTGGGSDANIFNENGIKTLNISTGMEKEHTCSERISIKNLELLTELVLKLMIV